jgi:hypothetical protein
MPVTVRDLTASFPGGLGAGLRRHELIRKADTALPW